MKFVPPHCAVFVTYATIALLTTYPPILGIGNSIPGDLGDPLLNVWVLTWDVKKFMARDFLTIFDENIFYPSKTTLAYSESMLANAMFVLPIMVVSKNPILTYNLIYLGSMTLSGFGTYLLALRLTRNRATAFCSGYSLAGIQSRKMEQNTDRHPPIQRSRTDRST